ncbi:MAG: SDR family oxidoreductase [Acidimicrobiales bacterium]
MKGKTVLITGATAGIGKAAAIELARRGADLALVARNPDKAGTAVGEITTAAPGTAVQVFRADLADTSQVRAVADEITSQLGRIDVLVNNAGIAARRSRRTVDGYDEMFAANYLGPFLLTHVLLDKVRSSAPARIVIVGSEAHRMAGTFDPERFEQLDEYSGLGVQLAYGRTKLLDILFADELARRLDGSRITVNSLCPGAVATELSREIGPGSSLGRLASLTPFLRTPEQGARMTVRLASSPEVEGVTGRFFTSTPGAGLLPTVAARRDPAIAARVYERTCKLVGVDPVAAAR